MDDHIILDMRGLTLNFSCDYAYITTPPYFVDIGSSFILFDNGNILVDGGSVFENGELNVTISKFQSQLQEFDIVFDGLSDLSIVITEKATSIANTILTKIEGILENRLQPKVLPLINNILHLIPSEIHIPHTDMYLQFGFHDKILFKENQFMRLPMCFSLQTEKEEFPDIDHDKMPDSSGDDYELEIFISEYVANSITHTLHVEEIIKINIPITTNLTAKIFGNVVFTYFEPDLSCKIQLTSVDPYPQVKFIVNETQFIANTTADFLCQKTANDSTLY